jgi:hypothetical protein
VTFTPTDASNYTTATATVAITVLKSTATITWPTPADITYGTALSATQLNATASVPGTFVYTPAPGQLLNAGVSQTLSVTFTPTDTSKYAPATKTVAINVLKAAPAVTWVAPADITYGTALSATQLNASSNVPGTFVYTPAAGVVLNAGAAQTLSVTFTPSDANYATATRTVAIKVLKATPTITWPTPADIASGTALGAAQLNATATATGTFTYTPAAGTVLKVGSAQTLSVTFAPADAANYTSATKTVTINVTKGTPTITWPTPADITYGTALGATQLNATSSVPGSFVYAPVAGTVLNAGPAQALSVTFTPTDTANYATATRTVSINVLKVMPVITWPKPAAISYGTALGATQLNATANMAGTFVYTPPAGTVLNAGPSQTLSATFTPSAGANYAIATASVLIDVLPGSPTITWPTPGGIVFGKALTTTELNATATMSGSTDSGTTAGGTSFAPAAETLTPTESADATLAAATVSDLTSSTPDAASFAPSAESMSNAVALQAPSLADVVLAGPGKTRAGVPGTFTYSPALGTVLKAGARQTLSVTFTPADAKNYRTSTATVTIDVAKATPAITWPSSADIPDGARLSLAHLKATANVEGTFAITPAPGTIVSAGATQTVSVTFTPADCANYAPVTRTVPINVLKRVQTMSAAAPAVTTPHDRSAESIAVALTADGSLPARFNRPLTWTAAANATSPLEYSFWREDNASWSEVQAYSPVSTYRWKPGYADIGSHALQVRVRRSGSTASSEGSAAVDFGITAGPLPVVKSLTPSTASPMAVKTAVTWIARVSGGQSEKCQFWWKDADDWQLARDYGSCQLTWTPKNEDVGSHSLRVWVRNGDSLAAFESAETVTFDVVPQPTTKSDVAPVARSNHQGSEK